MTILTVMMMMMMMMVLMLIMMVKPNQQRSRPYQDSMVNGQYFTHVHSHTYNPSTGSRFPASSSHVV